jgi:hypothetical protein
MTPLNADIRCEAMITRWQACFASDLGTRRSTPYHSLTASLAGPGSLRDMWGAWPDLFLLAPKVRQASSRAASSGVIE